MATESRVKYFLLRNEVCRMSGTGGTHRSLKVRCRFLPVGDTLIERREVHRMRNRLTREGKNVMRGMYRTNEHWGLNVTFSSPDYHGFREQGLKMVINANVLRSIYKILGENVTLRFSADDLRVIPTAHPRLRPPRLRRRQSPPPGLGRRRRHHRYHPVDGGENLINMMNPALSMNSAATGVQEGPSPVLMFPPPDSPGYTLQSGVLKIKKVQGTTPDSPERYICEEAMISLAPEFFPHWDSGYEITGSFTLEIHLPEEQIEVDSYEPEIPTYTRTLLKTLLNDSNFADVTIIAKNGARIPCHKCALGSQSEVLRTRFITPLKEESSDEIDMSEMSELGVRAFLAFLYTGDTTAAEEYPEICIDLLMAGHRFKVKPLENAMRTLLETESASWLNANACVRLFIFGRLVGNAENLVSKAVEALKLNASSLQTSEEYRRLFQTDPQSAMELSQFALIG